MRQTRCSGYTLVELMLVLALIAAIAGISWPALLRPWSRSLAQQAAHDFAEQLQDARLRAIEDGRVYRVQWQPGRGDFEISAPAAAAETLRPSVSQASAIPDDPAALLDPAAAQRAANNPADSSLPSTEPSGAGAALPAPLPTRQPLHVHAQLLNGVVFVDPNRQRDDTGEAELAAIGADQAAATNEAQTQNADDNPLAPLENGDERSAEPTWSAPVWLFPDGRTSNLHVTLSAEDGHEIDVDVRGITGTVRISPVRNAPPIDADALPPDADKTTATDAPRAPQAAPPTAPRAMSNTPRRQP